MPYLPCEICVPKEIVRIERASKLVDKYLGRACFISRMRDRGVSFGDTMVVSNITGRYPIIFYREDSLTIGKMYPDRPYIYLNRKFHDTFTYCETAANLAHELAHHAGFRHQFVDVAYATGDSFLDCCNEQ